MIRHIIPVTDKKPKVEYGIYIGIFLIGSYSAFNYLYPTLGPKFGYWWPLNDKLPLWGQIYNSLSGFINTLIDILSITLCLSYITNNWSKRLYLGSLYAFFMGLAITSQNRGAFEALHIWIFAAIICTLILLFIHKEIIRFYPSLTPVIAGTIVVINKLALGLPNLYSGQLFSVGIASLIVIGLTYFCYMKIEDG